jgi:hypothetical protein
MNPFLTENDDDSIKDLFRKKQIYKIITRSEHVNLIDFHFAEKALYGRVDRDYQPIIPHDRVLGLQYLSAQSPAGLQAFNFVTDAFRELQNKFKIKAARHEISLQEKYLTDIIPTAAYKDPKELYTAYTRSYSTAVQAIVKKKKLKFTNFQEFLNLLMPYIENALKKRSFTFPAYVKSKDCPINASGLAIEIAAIDPNNDKEKYDNFYNSANWDFFVNACNTYGFMVDANNPNRIVADIASPTMVAKMLKYDSRINNTDAFLNNCYDKAALVNFNSFKRFFYLLYSENRRDRVLTTTHNHNDNTRTVTHKVINYTYEQFLNEFDDLYFLNLYCKIRFMEEESQFPNYELHTLIQNTVELAVQDLAYALNVFEQILNKTFDYSGSLSYILDRKKKLGL